jgi:hypothetical protein
MTLQHRPFLCKKGEHHFFLLNHPNLLLSLPCIFTAQDADVNTAKFAHFYAVYCLAFYLYTLVAHQYQFLYGPKTFAIVLRPLKKHPFPDFVILSLSFAGLYALINNAGVCVCGEFDWQTWDQINSQVEVSALK